MESKAIFTGESCIAYRWSGVTSEDDAPPIKCDSNVPTVAQVSGVFSKVLIEGSCDGKDSWDVICSFPMAGIRKIDIRPLFIRPRVLGGEATITVNIRR